MKRILVLAALVLLVAVPFSEAKLFETPEAVRYLHARVEKTGSAFLEPTGIGASVAEIRVKLSVPQNFTGQEATLLVVQGPDGYNLSKDEFGNEIIELGWKEPDINTYLNYTLVYDVRVGDSLQGAPEKDFPLTDMIRATPDMRQDAYEITWGLGEKERILRLGSWVYDWVDYDKTYENTQKSAQWVYENRKAVCDGHSNLLISMLRALGYNAYYVIGYAYREQQQESYWGPHGWVEVEYEGELMTIDPTWAESPVDSTHIKFANAPDSNYTEYMETLASKIKVNWERREPVITMIEKEEGPLLSMESKTMPHTLLSSSYGMISAEIEPLVPQDCVMGRLKIQGCMSGTGEFFSFTEESREVLFCGNKTIYWFLKTPKMQSGVEYTCPVTIYGMGSEERVSTKSSSGQDTTGLSISTEKVLLPGQEFTVSASLANAGFGPETAEVYMFFGSLVKTETLSIPPGSTGRTEWILFAPHYTGEYPLRVFSSAGDYAEENITVVDVRYISLEDVVFPPDAREGEPVCINVTVMGHEKATMGTITIALNGSEESRDFIAEPGKEKTFIFIMEPDSPGNKDFSVDVLAGSRYEAGFSGQIAIIREKTIIDNIADAVNGFLYWFASLFGGVVG